MSASYPSITCPETEMGSTSGQKCASSTSLWTSPLQEKKRLDLTTVRVECCREGLLTSIEEVESYFNEHYSADDTIAEIKAEIRHHMQ